jgi:putative transposase
MNAAQLVFIDETWATTNMARRCGRAPRGQRLVTSVPYGHWQTSTFLAALRHDRITAPYVLEGAINGEIFRAYVEQMLAPTLEPDNIVVMDNLGSHKVAACARPSKRAAPLCFTCHPTVPISIPSSRSSPS